MWQCGNCEGQDRRYMWQLDKAPCPPPGVYADVLYETAQNNGLSQNVTEQIRRRCNVSDAPTTTTTTTTTTSTKQTTTTDNATVTQHPSQNTTGVTTTTKRDTTSFADSHEKTTANVGLIVGIVLGVAAVLVLVAVAVYLYKR